MDRVEALAVFSLTPSFSIEELHRAYRNLALRHHPDKNPQDVERATIRMLRINEAHEVLEASIADANEWLRQPCAGSPAPQPECSSAAYDAASQLMHYLASVPRRHSLRAAAGTLRAQVRSAMSQLQRIMRFIGGVMRICADRAQQLLRSQRQISWSSAGLKDLSYHGYDTVHNGTRPIDYGNAEYTTMLGAPCLLDKSLHTLLNRLQSTWPSLDLWFEPKSDHQCEMLGDITIFSTRWSRLKERCCRSCSKAFANSADSSTCSTATFPPAQSNGTSTLCADSMSSLSAADGLRASANARSCWLGCGMRPTR